MHFSSWCTFTACINLIYFSTERQRDAILLKIFQVLHTYMLHMSIGLPLVAVLLASLLLNRDAIVYLEKKYRNRLTWISLPEKEEQYYRLNWRNIYIYSPLVSVSNHHFEIGDENHPTSSWRPFRGLLGFIMAGSLWHSHLLSHANGILDSFQKIQIQTFKNSTKLKLFQKSYLSSKIQNLSNNSKFVPKSKHFEENDFQKI